MPEVRRKARRVRRTGNNRIIRWLLATLYVAVAAWSVFALHTSRSIEGGASAWVMNHLFGMDVQHTPGNPTIVVHSQEPFILLISPECAVAYIVAPLLVVAALLTIARRFNPFRIALATAISTAVVVAVNQVRISAVGMAMANWGSEGYGWMHTVGGSVMTLLGIAGALTLLWLLGVRESKSQHRRRSDRDQVASSAGSQHS